MQCIDCHIKVLLLALKELVKLLHSVNFVSIYLPELYIKLRFSLVTRHRSYLLYA
jgi:hypothetical protein